MKTPGEILEQIFHEKYSRNYKIDYPSVCIREAMEEYAQQEAEAFADWIKAAHWTPWISAISYETKTTSELYQEFLKQRT